MDPNATLKLIRETVAGIQAGGILTHDQLLETTERLAETVGNLDAWLANGGFLPKAWDTAKKNEKRPQLPTPAERHPTFGNLASTSFCVSIVTGLSLDRREDLEMAYGTDTAFLGSLAWWHERAEIWVTSNPVPMLDDDPDRIWDRYIVPAAINWLNKEVELPADVTRILNPVIAQWNEDQKE